MSALDKNSPKNILVLFSWISIAFSLPLIFFCMLAPALDHLEYSGEMIASVGYGAFWFVWFPLHLFVWFMILPGRLVIRNLNSKKLSNRIKLFSYVCAVVYVMMIIGGWVFLLIQDLQRADMLRY